MNPDPIQGANPSERTPFGSATTRLPQPVPGLIQPISTASISAAENTAALLDKIAKMLIEDFAPGVTLVACDPLDQQQKLLRLIIGQSDSGVEIIVQNLRAVKILRSDEEIKLFDSRQSELRNLRDLHLFKLEEANQREDQHYEFVRKGSIDLLGQEFRAQTGEITDPTSPWSEFSVIFKRNSQDAASLIVGRSDPHETVSPQSVEFKFCNESLSVDQVVFGGERNTSHTRAYRPQLEVLCERQLPYVCNWIEQILLLESPWKKVGMSIGSFQTSLL